MWLKYHDWLKSINTVKYVFEKGVDVANGFIIAQGESDTAWQPCLVLLPILNFNGFIFVSAVLLQYFTIRLCH